MPRSLRARRRGYPRATPPRRAPSGPRSWNGSSPRISLRWPSWRFWKDETCLGREPMNPPRRRLAKVSCRSKLHSHEVVSVRNLFRYLKIKRLVQEVSMTASQTFLEHAECCAHLADTASSQPSYRRFKRMESAWRALALEEDWLDGKIPPAAIATPMGRLTEMLVR